MKKIWSNIRYLGRAAGHFWSSGVNSDAVALLDAQPGHTVVDLAAGMGPATVALAADVGPTGRVVAIDPSRLMRTTLQLRTLRHRGGAPVEVREGLAEDLPLDDNSVDAIISLNSMHHFDDLEAASAELARVLKPGGRLLLIDEEFDNPDHSFHRETWEHGHGHDPDDGPEFVDPETMAALLREAGLTGATGSRRDLGGEPAFVVEATAPT